MSQEKQFYFDTLNSVLAKQAALPAGSHIAKALSTDFIAWIKDKIDCASKKDLEYSYWPPVYGLIASIDIQRLAELDADIDLVLANSSSASNERTTTQFLRCTADDKLGHWYGGLFDVWAKARAVKTGHRVVLDNVLPNGRDHDILMHLGERRIHIETTAITRDDESQEVWDRFLVDKRLDPNKVLIRPGAYCPRNAKGPSPYYDALRLYAKIFDKLARGLNPGKSQCWPGEANVLLVSFAGPGVSASSPSVGWVLDELFADQPKMVRTIAPDGITDISLDAWLEFSANELMARREITADFFCDNYSALMACPRQLSAVMLFEGSQLYDCRLNYNANSRLSHREIAELENLFSGGATYWL